MPHERLDLSLGLCHPQAEHLSPGVFIRADLLYSNMNMSKSDAGLRMRFDYKIFRNSFRDSAYLALGVSLVAGMSGLPGRLEEMNHFRKDGFKVSEYLFSAFLRDTNVNLIFLSRSGLVFGLSSKFTLSGRGEQTGRFLPWLSFYQLY